MRLISRRCFLSVRPSALQFQPMRGPRQILAGAVFERGVEFWEPDGKGALRTLRNLFAAMRFRSTLWHFHRADRSSRQVQMIALSGSGNAAMTAEPGFCTVRAEHWLAWSARSHSVHNQRINWLLLPMVRDYDLSTQNRSRDQCEHLSELPVAGR